MIKILIIEDDKKMVSLYQRVFSLAGFDVSVENSGENGLKKAQSLQPNVILLDIMMPKMNGVQVLLELSEDPKTTKIPIIMLTNVIRNTLNPEEQLISRGAARYIVKSEHEPSEIVEIVNEVLEERKS